MKKIVIIIIISILLILPISSAANLFEKNIRSKNKIYSLDPIGIKIGDITIDADGTLRGTNVNVDHERWGRRSHCEKHAPGAFRAIIRGT